MVASARKLEEISYDEMLELASLGAKVMQSRSVEFAKKYNVKFEVRSSLNTNPGTIVKEETASMEAVVVRGVSLDKNQAKVTLVLDGVCDLVINAPLVRLPHGVRTIVHDGSCFHFTFPIFEQGLQCCC